MNKLGKVIGPYAYLIKPVLFAIFTVFVFVSGCNYGKVKQEAEVVRLSGQVQALAEANNAFKQEGKLAASEAKRQQDAWKALEKAAGKAADRIEAGAEQTARDVRRADSELEKAILNPKCNELLELSVCPNIPIP